MIRIRSYYTHINEKYVKLLLIIYKDAMLYKTFCLWRRLGYGPGSFLSVKTKNKKLLDTLEDEYVYVNLTKKK